MVLTYNNMESQVIGAILAEPNNITLVASFLHPKHFSDVRHRDIYSRLYDMFNQGERIDLPMAVTACKSLKSLNGENVPALLAGYMIDAPIANIANYARKIVEQYLTRQVHTGIQLIECRIREGKDVSEIINDLNTLTDDCNGEIVGRGIKSIDELLPLAITEAENRQRTLQNGGSTGITTGIQRLDNATGGWKPSQLIVLAGRPAMGKTAVMLHFALSAARQGRAVCIYSLEMSSISLTDRMLLAVSGIDAERYRSGRLSTDDWRRINDAEAEMKNLPIYIDETATASMHHIRAQSMILQKRGQCDIIFVDYLQLVNTSTGKNRNREQEIAETSRSAKVIAKELGVPFVLLSQLSRKVEDRADKTPQLADLRESGAIEQDADVVAFIYRPAYYGEETITTDKGAINAEGIGVLSIAKQRDGRTGKICFAHNYSLTKIEDYTSIEV